MKNNKTIFFIGSIIGTICAFLLLNYIFKAHVSYSVLGGLILGSTIFIVLLNLSKK